MTVRPNAHSPGAACWAISATFALMFCLGQAGAMASLIAGGAGFAWVAPVMALAALVAGARLAAREGLGRAGQWGVPACCFAVVVAAVAGAAFYYDLSWDGEWYHQTAILGLAQGWNALADPLRSFDPHLDLWVDHYAKGPWYAAAVVFSATGHVEWAKAIDGIALAALFSAALGAGLDCGLSRARAWTLAAVVAFNPVVLSELTTFMVDGIMYAFLVVAIAATWTWLQSGARPAVLVAGAAAAIACINAKFTGLVFLCFVAAAAVIWCLACRRDQFLRWVVTAAAVLVLGAAVWGYNPYVTNAVHRHQPFYPVLGSAAYPSLTQQGKDGIENWETPRNLKGRDRLVRFAYAVFGRPGNQPYRIGKNASLMWPFTAQRSDLYAYHYHETRVGGFGPEFSGCLLVAFACGVWLLATGPRRGALVLVSLAIIASLLISTALWWPRYGPQLWLLAAVPLVFLFSAERPRAQVCAGWVLAAMLLGNAAVVGAVRFRWETRASLRLRQQLTDLRESGKTYDVMTREFRASMNERLTEAGVRYHDVGKQSLRGSVELTSVVEGYPEAVRYAPAK